MKPITDPIGEANRILSGRLGGRKVAIEKKDENKKGVVIIKLQPPSFLIKIPFQALFKLKKIAILNRIPSGWRMASKCN